MKRLDSISLTPFLLPEHKAALNLLFSSNQKNWMPHELMNSTGLSNKAVLAMMLAIEGSGSGSNLNLIYHNCCEVPVAATPLRVGFPVLPWTCPACGEEVNDPDELRYDIMLVLSESIELE